ncbi:MAG TPA: hypothetical protein VMV66_03440 [Candidatus Humimicrobiaceae bacterium]|nr:hypothetical protein [Candidatus Humimicrobiaceae bacterium]
MKITAKIHREDQSLVTILAQRDIAAKLVKGGVIVSLPVTKKESLNNHETYEIPAELKDATLLIDVAEEGGGRTKSGSGIIICGLNGKALRPYYIPRGGDRACNTHAYFSVSHLVVTITGYRLNSKVTIEEHWIVRDGSVAQIKSREIWSGELEVLPDSFSRFQSAAEAANEKANCYHCRHVHYSFLPEASPER